MRIIVHKDKGCNLCQRMIYLLKKWGIKYTSVYDNPTQDRPYPYLELLDVQYEEMIEIIASGSLNV